MTFANTPKELQASDLEHVHFSQIPWIRKVPNNPTCKPIDITRLSVSLTLNNKEFSHQLLTKNIDIERKIDVDGNGSIILRYKWRHNNIDYPVTILGFQYENNEIKIRQLQWAHTKYSYAFHSSVDEILILLNIIEETFFKNFISVTMEKSDIIHQMRLYDLSEKAEARYKRLFYGIQSLRKQYWYE